MLEPDATSRAPEHPGVPASRFGPDALQILTTEHWSLLATRGLVYTEAMSRTSIFIAALSGAVVALALVAQATDFGSGFVAFALVLLPVVYFVGWATLVRLSQVNYENARWVQGMNRIRHAYLDIAPELEPYFVTSKYDDNAGILATVMPGLGSTRAYQALASAPGIVAVINAVVAGAVAGVAAMALDLGVAWSLVLGSAGFLASMGCFAAWASSRIGEFRSGHEPLFPSPPSDGSS
jgi:hypothetical protein